MRVEGNSAPDKQPIKMKTYLVHLSEDPARGQKESFVLVEATDADAASATALEDSPEGFGVYGVFLMEHVSGRDALPTNRNLFPRY